MTESILRTRQPGLRSRTAVRKSIRIAFYIFVLNLALPIFDVPFLGLSLSAPIFFLIAMEVLFRSHLALLRRYQRWIMLAVAIWLGIFISGMLNGLFSGGTDFDTDGLITIVRYAYWLLVFVVTTYVISVGKMGALVARLLGWGIFILALLRWLEVIVYGNLGAWTGTHLLSQNTYGFLFSMFSPFLFTTLLEVRGVMRWLAVGANLTLWGAAAINGSRGSWVAMGVTIAVQLVLLWMTRPRRSFLPAVAVLVVVIIGSVMLATPNPIAQAVETRFSTFNNLEEDKSYAIRLLMNQKAMRLFDESPIIGVGPSRFRKESIMLDMPLALSYAVPGQFDRKSAHNSYLSFLAETGLVGAIPFGILLSILVINGGLSTIAMIKRGQYWAAGIFGGFVGMSIHMWVINTLSNSGNWMVYGLVAGMIVTANQICRESRQS
jgi:O-antigen ligase